MKSREIVFVMFGYSMGMLVAELDWRLLGVAFVLTLAVLMVRALRREYP